MAVKIRTCRPGRMNSFLGDRSYEDRGGVCVCVEAGYSLGRTPPELCSRNFSAGVLCSVIEAGHLLHQTGTQIHKIVFLHTASKDIKPDV